MTNPNSATLQPQKKSIVANFDAGRLTSDAGAILLRQIDENLQLSRQINDLILDPRDQRYVSHQQRDMIAQRIFAIALGYEDVNDHEELRRDPALLASIKEKTDADDPLASSPTLCRLENRVTQKENTALQKLLVEQFIQSHSTPPDELVIDVDATNDTVHGQQIGERFNKYYGEHCFLPLYFFCGSQLLWAQLRSPKNGQAFHALGIFSSLVKRLRESWPDVKILLRADAGFYSPRMLFYCDKYGVKYIIGYSKNSKLKTLSAPAVVAAKLFFRDAAVKEPLRIFDEYWYQAGTWKAPRRVIVKAERITNGFEEDGKENTRYIVTNLEGDAQYLYEDVYCARGDMENRIKEQQGMLFADRTSCHEFEANQFRLLLSSFAYLLLETLRRTALAGTELAKAQCNTIRLKLLKVGALVKESVRRMVISMSSAYPHQSLWLSVLRKLAEFSSPGG